MLLCDRLKQLLGLENKKKWKGKTDMITGISKIYPKQIKDYPALFIDIILFLGRIVLSC